MIVGGDAAYGSQANMRMVKIGTRLIQHAVGALSLRSPVPGKRRKKTIKTS